MDAGGTFYEGFLILSKTQNRTMPLLKEHPGTPEQQVATQPAQISMTSELMRKMIHLCSIGIPTLYILFTREIMLWLLIPATLFSFLVEILRFNFDGFDRVFRRMFGPILRQHEREGKPKLSGATYVLLSATICVLIFPKVITIAGFTVLIISDTAAALFGRRYGRHRFLEKSVEGSGAFFVTAMLVVVVVGQIFHAPLSYYLVGIVAAAASTVAEAMSYGVNIDDNLTIPLSFGIVMWGLLALIGGPEIGTLLAQR
jgi:dolichol kinase